MYGGMVGVTFVERVCNDLSTVLSRRGRAEEMRDVQSGKGEMRMGQSGLCRVWQRQNVQALPTRMMRVLWEAPTVGREGRPAAYPCH